MACFWCISFTSDYFLAFLLSVGFGEGRITGWSPGVFIASIIGLVLCIVWMMVCLRFLAIYDNHVTQAEKAKPSNCDLVVKPKRRELVLKIGGRSFRMEWVGKFRIRYAIATLMVAFFITYLVIFVLRGPWMP